MRLETCIRKGLRLKSHRVLRVCEEQDRLVAEIEWIPAEITSCFMDTLHGDASKRNLLRDCGQSLRSTVAPASSPAVVAASRRHTIHPQNRVPL